MMDKCEHWAATQLLKTDTHELTICESLCGKLVLYEKTGEYTRREIATFGLEDLVKLAKAE